MRIWWRIFYVDPVKNYTIPILKNKDVYHVKNAIKIGQYNVGRVGNILTIPLYMGFLVNDKLADVIIPDVDVSFIWRKEYEKNNLLQPKKEISRIAIERFEKAFEDARQRCFVDNP